MRLAVVTCAIAAVAFAAAAQTRAPGARAPAQRQTMTALSRTLGEAHALRQLCRTRDDQYWREKMQAMIAAEKPDKGLEAEMEAAFNAGYAGRQGEFSTCTADARQTESQVDAKGEALARQLAKPEG